MAGPLEALNRSPLTGLVPSWRRQHHLPGVRLITTALQAQGRLPTQHLDGTPDRIN